jgi:hypothetical protein
MKEKEPEIAVAKTLHPSSFILHPSSFIAAAAQGPSRLLMFATAIRFPPS